MKKSTSWVLWFGSPEKHADIRYVTGVNAPDEIVVLGGVAPCQTGVRGKGLGVSGQWSVISSELEYGRIRQAFRKGKVWTPQMLKKAVKPWRGMGKEEAGWGTAILRLLRHHTARRVTVPWEFPVGMADFLGRHGVKVRIGKDLNLSRVIKTAHEQRKIAATQAVARAAMALAGRMIRGATADRNGTLRWHGKPLTSETVKAHIRALVVARGCMDTGTIVAGGRQGANPHETGHGPLKTGELIVVDIFPQDCETGYWGDMTRTFHHGALSPERRAMLRAVKQAHKAALATLRPGISGKVPHRAAEKALGQAGFETALQDGLPVGFIHSTGHGVGLAIHESPTLSRRSATTLRPGMVVTVEPGLYYPGQGACRIEDVVQVTDAKPKMLSNFHYDWEIKQ
ncbi:MAG: Xaa-Pro peptidase family protein [Kiritimatiellaeota bacterium]|nr:Xaa-Pro peptidase family protein [Kiritimatiellota bacterium]